MALLTVIAEPRRPSTCRSCGAAIVWAQVVDSGKRIPFNAPFVAVPAQVAGHETVDTARTIPHFATCPQAAEWRHRR